MSGQQRLHLTLQFRIAAGGCGEERRALLGCHRECRVIELPDVSMPLGRHEASVARNSR